MNMGTRLNAIEIADVSLEFQTNDGPVRALSGVSLNIARGELVSFIGPSGCGKTTLLRAVADLEAPTGGAIRVNGMTPAQARAARAYGYVFQAPALYPWRTVAGNIALPLEIMGIDRAERKKRVERGLELVNLKGFGPKFPWQLSGGMQQRASIARALSFDPDLLLMDEPFGALDAQTRMVMQHDLQTLVADAGITVLFVTHDITEAVLLADQVVVLSRRPTRRLATIAIPLPRPRDVFEPFSNPGFAQAYDHVWSIFRSELRASGIDKPAASP
jgi:NitT/TauT family transport system ATP-binding protein